MGLYRLLVGKSGEEEAARLLKKSGYRIIERNFRSRFGEVDIIAKDGDTLVFVEVKTRRTEAFGPSTSSVDASKQKRIIAASTDYMMQRRINGVPVRFDVVGIELKDGHYVAEHVKNAFDSIW